MKIIALLLGASVLFASPELGEPLDQVRGFYTKGSLNGASSIGWEGDGFVKLFRARNRQWGSQGLAQVIATAALETRTAHPDGERVQVGDLSAKTGAAISGHGSHQNGLDADLSYFRVDQREQSPDDLSGFDEEFVVKGKLTPNFDLERNWTLVRRLVASGRVQRIFVDTVIKEALCDFSGPDADAESIEALRRLRPWPNHGDHMHIRLTCPPESKNCVVQEDVPPGSGCSPEELATPDPAMAEGDHC